MSLDDFLGISRGHTFPPRRRRSPTYDEYYRLL